MRKETESSVLIKYLSFKKEKRKENYFLFEQDHLTEFLFTLQLLFFLTLKYEK